MKHHILRHLFMAAALAAPATALATTATVHKTPTCGCCDFYVEYLEARGYELTIVDHDSMVPLFEEAAIDLSLASCHTTEVGPYTVVGHMPVEAIEQLLAERPMIRGITLPGMPIGSPGMPGAQQEPFTVYRISANVENPEVYGQF